MKLRQVLLRARETLIEHKIEDANLISEMLLSEAAGKDRLQLFMEPDAEITADEEESYTGLIKRCLAGEPVAYIVGHREFYDLDFYVDPRVLIPRPETELLIEKALTLAKYHANSLIADICTGSGVIAISLAKNLSQAKIYAADISLPALEVARFNSRMHQVNDRISFLWGSLLEPLPEPVDLIIINPPYVKCEDVCGNLSFEPALALDGGIDGLDKIRELCRQISGKLLPGGSLLMEIGQGQSGAVTALLHNHLPAARIEVFPDLAGIERVISLNNV